MKKKSNFSVNNNFNVTVFASGGGGNFKALIKNQKKYGYKINFLIVDRECNAINVAKIYNIPYALIKKNEFKKTFYKQVEKKLPPNTDLIVLAGFLSIIDDDFCKKWAGKIINTHPSLLPKYGGKGMIGVKVQEQVIKNKDKIAGCTIHYVNNKIDGGKIIVKKSIRVKNNETPWELGGRVHKLENKLLPKAIKIVMQTLKK